MHGHNKETKSELNTEQVNTVRKQTNAKTGAVRTRTDVYTDMT